MIFNADQGSPIVAVDKSLNVTDRVLVEAEGLDGSGGAAPVGAAAPAPSGVTRPATRTRKGWPDVAPAPRDVGGEGARVLTAAAIAALVGGDLHGDAERDRVGGRAARPRGPRRT